MRELSELSDSDLWAAAQDGDAPAFGVLYERHARTIYNYLFRRLGDWSEAEDLTAIVFLEAYRRRREIGLQNANLLPWFYGVATNVLRNRRRAMRRHRHALARLPRPDIASDDMASETVARIEAEMTMKAVLPRIRALPRAQQDVVVLCLWSDLSYEDAAACLGIPVGTVRSRLARARQALAEIDVDERNQKRPRYIQEVESS